MNHRCGVVAAAAAVGFVAASSMAGVKLVTNGSFETGDFTGWTVQLAAIDSDLGVIAQPHTGDFSAIFSADGAENDAIFQTLTLEPGQEYRLDYWIQNLGVGNDFLRVSVEGGFDISDEPVGTELEVWVMRSITFMATEASAELRFEGRDNNAAFLIDDVSVTLVPTPGSTALMSLAGVCMVCLRRRR